MVRPMTIAEKILARASGKNEVKPGEYLIAKIDLLMAAAKPEEKEPPKENGIEVLKRSEMANQTKGTAPGGKSIKIGYSQRSSSGSGGGSTTVRSGRS